MRVGPSIRCVRARHLSALTLGVLAVAGLTVAPASAATPLIARAASGHGKSVSAALLSLEQSGAITAAAYQKDLGDYVAAKRSLGRLGGTRRTELGAVLSNLQAIAARGGFIPSRLPVLFLTLERNRQWWTTEPLLSSGERVHFPESKIVWEYYAGQGIEIQWLATFGEANGYYLAGYENANLRQLLSEVLPLASRRAGGIAWEYVFSFDGGSPPWTSGLSQGTALQVLARAWSRFKEPALLTAAQQALGVFQTPPPSGVRVKTAAGALYAEYTYAPSDRILNGFIQAVVGLYDYASITQDPLGLKLFEAGDGEARAEVPHYDRGAWSLYDQFGESNLNYHELLTEFLEHLCQRTRKGPPFTTPTPTAPTPASPPAPAPGGSGTGAAAAPPSSATAAKPAPIAGDEIYCSTAQRFTADLSTPPVIALLTRTLRGGTRAGVQMSLSKVSTVGLTVRHGARVVWTNRATVAGGKPRLLWLTPAGGGIYTVTLTATDPAGNFATTNGTIVVAHH
jgi:D-glucuronyl C5-epimerase C-terminus